MKSSTSCRCLWSKEGGDCLDGRHRAGRTSSAVPACTAVYCCCCWPTLGIATSAGTKKKFPEHPDSILVTTPKASSQIPLTVRTDSHLLIPSSGIARGGRQRELRHSQDALMTLSSMSCPAANQGSRRCRLQQRERSYNHCLPRPPHELWVPGARRRAEWRAVSVSAEGDGGQGTGL